MKWGKTTEVERIGLVHKRRDVPMVWGSREQAPKSLSWALAVSRHLLRVFLSDFTRLNIL
jgi:hypothetical protein